jgi:hypothetical protein
MARRQAAERQRLQAFVDRFRAKASNSPESTTGNEQWPHFELSRSTMAGVASDDRQIQLQQPNPTPDQSLALHPPALMHRSG